MLFEVTYPSGERTWAVGYPDTTLVVNQVPPGPESCYGDVIEVDATGDAGTPCRVLRVVGGARRPTIRVRVAGDEAARDVWMAAREGEGWETLDGQDADAEVVWAVATRDGLDVASLEGPGATVLAR